MQPDKDGTVILHYYQQWTCLSGNIPWVTVGLPNSSFSIIDSFNNISKIRADNSGGFSGVYLSLDKTYLANQSFTVSFTVRQSNLLELLNSGSQWRINYTAGWYDQAHIDHMIITLNLPVALDSFTFTTKPDTTSANSAVWERMNLPAGYRFNVNFESTDSSFLTAVPEKQSTPNTSSGNNVIWIVVFLFVIGGGAVALRITRRIPYQSPILSQIVDKNYWNQENKDVKEVWAEAVKDKDKLDEYDQKHRVDDQEKAKKIDEYAKEQDLIKDDHDSYRDDSGIAYSNDMLWRIVLWNEMNANARRNILGLGHLGGYYGGGYGCACACVGCACACACACAGGGAAGCTIKLKSGEIHD